jgi:hypothetical protein
MKLFSPLMILLSMNCFPQQLPLKIGNQWHYNYGFVPFTYTNVSTAVDTVRINNKLYYKIERRDVQTNELIQTSYDRIEGDSLYFRMENDTEYLVFNFGWRNGDIVVTPWIHDSTCSYIQIIDRHPTIIWGINTELYIPSSGIFCPEISSDTSWILSNEAVYSKYFGCIEGKDGVLTGAIINDTIYGDLLPVELLTFSKKISGNSLALEWSTATETNNYGFEILRNNSAIGFVKGNGTTTQKNEYHYSDDNLDAGNYNYNLIQIDFDGTRNNIAETEVSIEMPVQFTLSQNYPNPFNPTTTISFQILKESFVYIKVFDCLGNEIKSLISENKKEGSYTVKFDASNLANGIYFYQMKADNFISIKKMLVLK